MPTHSSKKFTFVGDELLGHAVGIVPDVTVRNNFGAFSQEGFHHRRVRSLCNVHPGSDAQSTGAVSHGQSGVACG